MRKSALQTHVKPVSRDRKLMFILAVVAIAPLIGLGLAFDVAMVFALLVFGIALLTFSAEKTVEHSVSMSSALGISPLVIGLLTVSLDMDVSGKLYLRSAEWKNTHREGDLKRG